MRFAQILSDVMEEDNGLLLRVTAFERMMEAREKPRGWAARTLDLLRRRSGKILVRSAPIAAHPMEGMKHVIDDRPVQ